MDEMKLVEDWLKGLVDWADLPVNVQEAVDEAMIAYVDENGHISDTPPSIIKKKIDHTTIEISIPKRTEEELPAIRKGRIDFFNDAKGFGFIKEHETNEKYFVHINGLIDRIQEGDVVTFELERGMKGMNAVRVKKA